MIQILVFLLLRWKTLCFHSMKTMVLPGAKPAIYRYAENTYSTVYAWQSHWVATKPFPRYLIRLTNICQRLPPRIDLHTRIQENCSAINILLTVFYSASVFWLALLTGHAMWGRTFERLATYKISELFWRTYCIGDKLCISFYPLFKFRIHILDWGFEY